MHHSGHGTVPFTPALPPQAGRGSKALNYSLAPRKRGEGGARVSGRVRGTSKTVLP